METMKITIGKLGKTITEESVKVELATVNIPIPNYVVDTEYHTYSVQAHINHILESDLVARLHSASNTVKNLTDKYEKGEDVYDKLSKAQDRENECKTTLRLFKNYLKDWKEEVEEEFYMEDLLANTIAQFQAISIFNRPSYKAIREKDGVQKTVDVKFSFYGMKDFSENVRKFGDESNTLNKSEKDAILQNINSLFNRLFAPAGGEVYKNRTWKLTGNKVMTLLYARSKKALKYNNKGTGIDDKALDDFALLMQGYLLSLSFSGIPLVDGNGIEHILDVDIKQEVKKPRRKKTEKNNK